MQRRSLFAALAASFLPPAIAIAAPTRAYRVAVLSGFVTRSELRALTDRRFAAHEIVKG